MAHATDAVHAGTRTSPSGAVNTPIEQSSTFLYPELPDGTPSAHIYTRYDNPTIQAVEARIARLEGAAGALAVSSGMSAFHLVCNQVLAPGRRLALQQGVYGGTSAYAADELLRWGVQVEDAGDGTKGAGDLVWVESVTNPLLRVTDLAAVRKAHPDAVLAVDATFATPILQRPLAHADVAMHSASKALGGHSDLIAGTLAWNDAELGKALWLRRRNHGCVMDPHAAFLLNRGIATLAARMQVAGANTLALAEAAKDAGITVHHPSLPDHPDHAVAKRMLDGPVAVMTIDLGSLEAAKAFRRNVRLFTPAASLGGVESLVSLPVETSHAYATTEERRAAGITDGLVRVSVGIEDLDDLQADLEQAAKTAKHLA